MQTKTHKRTSVPTPRINVITLGCSKNLVDSEVLLSQLQINGMNAVHEAPEDEGGIVVINTCGFIDNAKQESINTILDYVDRKDQGLVDKVVVTGCLSARYKEELQAEIPEVDAWFGNHLDLPHLLGYLGADYKKELVGERRPADGGHYAYLKIAEGCNRPCSFCAIPLMRGKHQSRDIDFLVREAEHLVSTGVKEIMLIAQDLTYYGIDLYGKRRLDDLLRQLSDVKGLEWLRLHYAYPSGFPVEILPVIRERSNICNYLDIPLQHISDRVLKSMRRGISKARTEDLISRIRDEVPGIAIRSTLLVGHPGETEEDHEELLDFLTRTRLERLGVFTYSHEEKTYAGEHFEDLIPEDEKERRKNEVMELQQDISFSLNRRRIGSHLKVVIDRKEESHWIGRSEFDSPEVDNEVIIHSGQALKTGSFYQVEITDAMEYDLIGRVLP